MAIVGTPICGSFVTCVDQASLTTSAGVVTDTVNLGTGVAAAFGTQFSATGGLANSLVVKASGSGTLAISTPLNLDLFAGIVDIIGTKIFAKLRVLRIFNGAAVGSGFNLTVGPGASNGVTTPFLTGTTPAIVIPPQSSLYLENLTVAAWAVSNTQKTIKLDPGTNAVPYSFFFGGE